MLAEDIWHPEKQLVVFERRYAKYKRQKKRDKRGRGGASSRKGSLKKREVSKHQETLTAESFASLGSTEGNITGRKSK